MDLKLSVDRDTILLEYCDRWVSTICEPGKSDTERKTFAEITGEGDGGLFEVGGVKVGLHRTLRVPDDGNTHLLPPVSSEAQQRRAHGRTDISSWLRGAESGHFPFETALGMQERA